MQPGQQQGLRIPPFIFESAFPMRILLVSSFLPDVIQQIHSLRARGVISSQRANTVGEEAIAFRKSAGSLCTVPPAIPFCAIKLVYQILFRITFLRPPLS
jgi:hypothetical protein